MMGLAIPNDSGRYSLAWHESVRDASDTMRHSCAPEVQQNTFFKRDVLSVINFLYLRHSMSQIKKARHLPLTPPPRPE
jgi:hypothetical protein